MKKNQKVDILGTQYTITESDSEQDELLNNADGYCDKTTHKIVITTPTQDCSLGDWKQYRKKLLRHEIIHAFLFESGLHENFKHEQWGHDETQIDWFASQYPKIAKVFKAVGCE